MKSRKRIETALKYIDKEEKVVDIGCDHSYVLIEGVLLGKIGKGIGVEIADGPYKQAKKNIKENRLEASIEVRLGNGLELVEIGDGNVCVIGGMGGGLIKQILCQDIKKAQSFKSLILQPMGNEKELRKFLLKNNWEIAFEEVLITDKIYLYIVAKPKGKNAGRAVEYPEDIYEIGPVLMAEKSRERDEYIKGKILKSEKILKELNKGKSRDKLTVRKKELEDKIKRWRSYLEN